LGGPPVLVDVNGDILDHLAGAEDYEAPYEAALKRWPRARIQLCQEAGFVEDSKWSRPVK
jgi:hypothetical protein